MLNSSKSTLAVILATFNRLIMLTHLSSELKKGGLRVIDRVGKKSGLRESQVGSIDTFISEQGIDIEMSGRH